MQMQHFAESLFLNLFHVTISGLPDYLNLYISTHVCNSTHSNSTLANVWFLNFLFYKSIDTPPPPPPKETEIHIATG